MPAPSTASLAERVARQLGVETVPLAGSGPSGSATLNDVLRQAGRALPAATRHPPPQSASCAGEGASPEPRRLETACDAKPIRDACNAFAVLLPDIPEIHAMVVRLCGAALRDFPQFAGGPEGSGESLRRGSVDLVVEGLARSVAIRGADVAGIGSVREAVRAAGSASRAESSGPAEDAVEPPAAFVIRMQGTREVRPGRPSGGSGVRRAAVLTIAERSGSLLLGLEFDVAPEEDGEAFLDRLRSLCLDPRRALL